MQDDKGLEDVIAKFRAQRELQKAAAAQAANLKVQAEVNVLNANANKTSAEAAQKKVLSEEAKAKMEAKAKITEANVERIKADAELLKAKADNLDVKSKLEADQLKIEQTKAESNKMALEIKREEVSVREQKDFASNMDKLRETIEGPVDRLLGSISASTNFDARKKPGTTLVALGSIGLNNLATQDRTPPIYGMIAKLLGFFATTASFYTGKGFEALITKIKNPGVSRDALRLTETDSILKEVAKTNKALAIEMAQLKIARFKQATIDKFEKEKSQFISKEKNNSSKENIVIKEDTVLHSKLDNIISLVEGISNKYSTEPKIIIDENKVGNSKVEIDGVKLYSKLDDIILLVKTISNQYDPETDNERYTAEIKWRNDVLDRLNSVKVENKPEKKSGFGLLEFGAIAGIGAYVTSIVSSITKFLTPLSLLGRGLLTMSIPLTIAAAALMNIDWQKDILNPIQTIVKTFAQGDWIEGIGRSLLMIPELILKFSNRIVASISGILGFEKVEKELNAYVDRINIFDSIITFKNKILNYFDGTLKSFSDTFDEISLSIKERVASLLRNTILLLHDFDLSTSIKEFFDALSDKIESLKFWKTNKEYKTDTFKNNQSDVIKKEVNQLSNSKLLNQNTTNSTSIEKIENRIEKRQTNSITNLNKNFTDLQKKKEQNDSSKLQQMIEKTTSIIAPVSNTQINNNSSNTSIASRPYARINEYTADRSIFNNRSGDFSGFLM